MIDVAEVCVLIAIPLRIAASSVDAKIANELLIKVHFASRRAGHCCVRAALKDARLSRNAVTPGRRTACPGLGVTITVARQKISI